MKIQKSGNLVISSTTLIDLITSYQPKLAEKVSNLFKTLDHSHPEQKSLQELLKEFCSLDHSHPEQKSFSLRVENQNAQSKSVPFCCSRHQ